MIIIIILAILFLDQLTKFVIIKELSLYQSVAVIKDFFYLTLIHNRGAAFGIFQNQFYLFILSALVAIGIISFSLKNNKTKKFSLYNFSLALILSGALGNLIDRIRFGYVIDFFDFKVWPVFNVADSAITVGAIFLAWHILFSKKKKY